MSKVRNIVVNNTAGRYLTITPSNLTPKAVIYDEPISDLTKKIKSTFTYVFRTIGIKDVCIDVSYDTNIDIDLCGSVNVYYELSPNSDVNLVDGEVVFNNKDLQEILQSMRDENCISNGLVLNNIISFELNVQKVLHVLCCGDISDSPYDVEILRYRISEDIINPSIEFMKSIK